MALIKEIIKNTCKNRKSIQDFLIRSSHFRHSNGYHHNICGFLNFSFVVHRKCFYATIQNGEPLNNEKNHSRNEPFPPDVEEWDGPRDPYQMEHYQYKLNRYRPSPGDERDIGDYPTVPYVSDQLRPRHPDIPYDDVQNRRYRNEVLHEESDVLSMWYNDLEPSLPRIYMWTYFIGFWGLASAIALFAYYYEDPYKKYMAIPKTFFIDDPILKSRQDWPLNNVKVWPNSQSYLKPSDFPMAVSPSTS